MESQQDPNGVSGSFTPKTPLGLREGEAAPGEGTAAQPTPGAALPDVAASSNTINWAFLTHIETGN